MQTAKLSALVIESHPLMREAICAAIAGDASLASVLGVGSNTEAIEMMDGLRPGIILFAMENGLQEDVQALAALRQASPNVPIMALVSGETPGQEQAALALGINAVVSKAAPREELLDSLRMLFVLSQTAKDDDEEEATKNNSS